MNRACTVDRAFGEKKEGSRKPKKKETKENNTLEPIFLKETYFAFFNVNSIVVDDEFVPGFPNFSNT